jgi:hypothetical protein
LKDDELLLAYPHVCNHLGDGVIIVVDNVNVLLFPTVKDNQYIG